MNNQEIAIVGLSILVAWLCWVIRGAVLSSRDKSKNFALLQDTCDTWRETATRRAEELTEAWKQLKDSCEKAAKGGELQVQNDIFRELLVQSQEMLQKYVDASAAFSATVAGVDRNGPDHPKQIELKLPENLRPGELLFYSKCKKKILRKNEHCLCDECVPQQPLSPAMGVSGNVAEALIPTSDSIENEKPDALQFLDFALKQKVARDCDKWAEGNCLTGNGVDHATVKASSVESVLAHAEDRSNNYG